MLGKIERLLERVRRYSRWVGFGQAVFLVTADLLHWRSLRRIRIAGERIYLRTATPDILVAASCLVKEEYASLRSANPAVIVDAGAHIGTSAIYFAKRYPNARVFAIEPERENYAILLMNTDRYPNIFPIQAALWSHRETRPILDYGRGPWGYTVAPTDIEGVPTGQQVDCITMESLMDEFGLGFIDILKMDIEGGEKDVLEHAEGWMDKVGIITAELHERYCPGCEQAFQQATRSFARFDKSGEKVIAYRE